MNHGHEHHSYQEAKKKDKTNDLTIGKKAAGTLQHVFHKTQVDTFAYGMYQCFSFFHIQPIKSYSFVMLVCLE